MIRIRTGISAAYVPTNVGNYFQNQQVLFRFFPLYETICLNPATIGVKFGIKKPGTNGRPWAEAMLPHRAPVTSKTGFR